MAINPSISHNSPHQEGRTRSHLRARRRLLKRTILVLILGFLSSTITFVITFYSTSNFFGVVLSAIFSPTLTAFDPHLSARDLVKFYQPRDFSDKQKSVRHDHDITYDDFDFRKPETLTYRTRTYSNTTEILFRFPKKTSVSALLLVFHGCRHSASDWFHTTERQRIIGAAIDLGYACLVFQATDNTTQCWSHDADIYQNQDIQMVLKGLEGFYQDYPEAAFLPRYTFGSSSGGIFSSIFAINQQYRIQGQIIFISVILPEILYTYVKARNYPATVWIHMLRDIEFASEERINVSKQIFLEQHIPCITYPIEPVQITSTLFHDRIPSITYETSRYLHHQLQRYRWLNFHNYLMYNPRHKLAWQVFLFPSTDQQRVAGGKVIQNIHVHKKEISEFLNTIYGEHEISYERSSQALTWLKDLQMPSKQVI